MINQPINSDIYLNFIFMSREYQNFQENNPSQTFQQQSSSSPQTEQSLLQLISRKNKHKRQFLNPRQQSSSEIRQRTRDLKKHKMNTDSEEDNQINEKSTKKKQLINKRKKSKATNSLIFQENRLRQDDSWTLLAFLSYSWLYKLKKIIIDSNSKPLRHLLIEYIQRLNIENSQEIVEKFLQPYKLSKGKKNQLYDIVNTKGLIVYNPSTVMQKIIFNLSEPFTKLLVGKIGIGKSFSLLSLQELSFYRFRFLYNKNGQMESMISLIENNLDVLTGQKLQNEQIYKIRQRVIKAFKQCPLIIYYYIQKEESWESFYFKLKCQFPYIADPIFEQKIQNQQIGELKKNLDQNFYKSLAQELIVQIKRFAENLSKKGFAVRVIYDQVNNYYKEIKQYVEIQKEKTKLLNTQFKDKICEKKIQNLNQKILHMFSMKERIQLLSRIKVLLNFYFSDMAETQIFDQNPSLRMYFLDPLRIRGRQNQIQEFDSGIDLHQMKNIMVFLISQKIINRIKINQLDVDEDFALCVQRLVEESIKKHQEDSQVKNQALFKTNNSSYLNISLVLQNLKNEDSLMQIVKLLQNKIKQKKTRFQQIQLFDDVRAFLFEFIGICFERINEQNPIVFEKRLNKYFRESSEAGRKNMMHMLRQIQTLRSQKLQEEKIKFQLPQEYKVQKFENVKEGLFKGNFSSSTLIGTMEGSFEGEFNGEISGHFQQLLSTRFYGDEKYYQLQKIKKTFGRLNGKFRGQFKGYLKGQLFGQVKENSLFSGTQVENQNVSYWNEHNWSMNCSDCLLLLRPFRTKEYIQNLESRGHFHQDDQKFLRVDSYLNQLAKLVGIICTQMYQKNFKSIKIYDDCQFQMQKGNQISTILKALPRLYDQYMTNVLSELKGQLRIQILRQFKSSQRTLLMIWPMKKRIVFKNQYADIFEGSADEY